MGGTCIANISGFFKKCKDKTGPTILNFRSCEQGGGVRGLFLREVGGPPSVRGVVVSRNGKITGPEENPRPPPPPPPPEPKRVAGR